MRTLIVLEHFSIDGVMRGPDGPHGVIWDKPSAPAQDQQKSKACRTDFRSLGDFGSLIFLQR